MIESIFEQNSFHVCLHFFSSGVIFYCSSWCGKLDFHSRSPEAGLSCNFCFNSGPSQCWLCGGPWCSQFRLNSRSPQCWLSCDLSLDSWSPQSWLSSYSWSSNLSLDSWSSKRTLNSNVCLQSGSSQSWCGYFRLYYWWSIEGIVVGRIESMLLRSYLG